jgi:hypothetical protein
VQHLVVPSPHYLAPHFHPCQRTGTTSLSPIKYSNTVKHDLVKPKVQWNLCWIPTDHLNYMYILLHLFTLTVFKSFNNKHVLIETSKILYQLKQLADNLFPWIIQNQLWSPNKIGYTVVN